MKLNRITKLTVITAVAAAVAVPLAQAGTSDKIQLAGSFVAPGQSSEAQLNAGHDPATRMVQVGGALVAPSHLSAYEHAAGSASATGSSASSSGLGTGGIAAIAVLGAFAMIVAASMLVFRQRRRLVTAAC